MSTSNEEPPAKRQKRSLGASDRITVDVGGTKFITSVSTLTSNSTYFASLLSDNWSESNNGDDEIFLDQDPDPFRVILAYMREGFIKIGDINERVLAQAEFLGVERLLAVKVRWYHNIGKGPVHSTDEDIAAAFDQKYGGIMKAMSAGLFPLFLKQDDINAEKEFAILAITYRDIVARDRVGPLNRTRTWRVKEVGKPDAESQPYRTPSAPSALNGLHLKGYNVHETQLDESSDVKETFTFSRRKHSKMSSNATEIFIPNDEERNNQEKNDKIKQYALYVLSKNNEDRRRIIAPAEFHEDESMRSNPFGYAKITQCDKWLVNNGFMTREKDYEDLFQNYFNVANLSSVEWRIFSRRIYISDDV